MKKKFMGSRRNIALFLAMTMAVTGLGGLSLKNSGEKAHAAGTETVYFAEGFGTGVDFDKENHSWKIETTFDSGAAEIYKNDSGNQATIMKNNHSAEGEPVIRLINGVQNANLNSGESDYRAGTAISTQKVKLDESSQFSAKFTISMPDACVNSVQTGGEKYAREVGGDGISFIITTKDDINGQAGGGIGYYGVNNSIVVELDSYFNGAYCTFETSNTAYVNWDYDNQIYANTSYAYLSNIVGKKYTDYNSANNYGEFWEKVLKLEGYSELPGSAVRRFDHVGVTVDGDPKKHLGISYLNGLVPNEVKDGTYVNLSNASASTPSNAATCATRFADSGNLAVAGEGVDNRLFTFWVEYDGTNMYVSYANGNFLTAVRPATPQISIKGDAKLAKKFAGQEVNIGFTSAIGSSKANHTVHSIMFVNDYIEGGIENTTSYTEKYYVESPEATSDYITVGEKKYVLKDKAEKVNIPMGSSATISDKSSTESYKSYTLVDYSSNPLYPKSTECVKADGSTVLYQFYDLGQSSSCSYTVKYYLEVSETEKNAESVKVGEKWYQLQSDATVTKPAAEGTVVKTGTNTKGAGVLEGTTEVSDTFKNFENYGYNNDVTVLNGKASGTVKEDDLVIELFYDKNATTYKGEYYVELEDQTTTVYDKEIDGVKYKLNESYTSPDVALTSSATIIDKSKDSAYSKYELLAETSTYPQSVPDIDDNGATVVYQIYKIRPTFVLKPSYQVQYYIEVPKMAPGTIEIDGKYYAIQSEETMTKYATEGVKVTTSESPAGAGVREANEAVADTFKNFTGYTFNQTATDKNGKSSGAVTSDNSLVIMLMYDLDKVPETPTTPTTPTTPSTPTTPTTPTTPATPATPSTPATPTTPSTSTQTSTSNTTVATGDSGNMFFFAMFLASGSVVAAMLVGRKKRAGKRR